MADRRVIVCSAQYWNSAVQIGAQHYARQFVKNGWEVLFLATPITPFHAAAVPRSEDHRKRFAEWWKRGSAELNDHLHQLLPLTWLPMSSVVGLRYPSILRNWQHYSWPNVTRFVSEAGFEDVDAIIVDTPLYSWLPDVVNAAVRVQRITDFNRGFGSSTDELHQLEHELAAKSDLTIYTARQLESYATALPASAAHYVPNGVDFARFSGEPAVPLEYESIPHPRAVYVGSLREWFDYESLNRLAARRPDVSFVVIGPDMTARNRFEDHPNLHILGERPHERVPQYLAHADVGLITFDRENFPDLVDAVNPLKLYEYMASGLPVVSTDWAELRYIRSPALLCSTVTEFSDALDEALERRHELAQRSRDFARGADWSERFRHLLSAMHSARAAKE